MLQTARADRRETRVRASADERAINADAADAADDVEHLGPRAPRAPGRFACEMYPCKSHGVYPLRLASQASPILAATALLLHLKGFCSPRDR